MQSKIAALPREKLEFLLLKAVERTAKDTASCQKLASELDALRAQDAQIEARIKNIEQEREDLTKSKAEAEEKLQRIALALAELAAKEAEQAREAAETEPDAEDAPSGDLADHATDAEQALDADNPVAVAEHLRALEALLTSELDAAKQKMQAYRQEQDDKIEATNKRLEILKQEVVRGQTLAELEEEKTELQAKIVEFGVLPDAVELPEGDLEAVNADLARVVEQIRVLQTDICDAEGVHQHMIHAHQEEGNVLDAERHAIEAQLSKAREALLASERQKEDRKSLAKQLEEEALRGQELHAQIAPLQSECERLGAELARVRDENAVKLIDMEEEQARIREKLQEQNEQLQAQEKLKQLSRQRIEKLKSDTQQKLDEIQGKADDRLGALQQKIDLTRKELDEETAKAVEKDNQQASAEETLKKYMQVTQQASSKIQHYEDQAKVLMETLKDRQEELLVAQGKYRNTGSRGKEPVLTVDEDETFWSFNGENWYETTTPCDTMQSKAKSVRKRLEVDMETLSHQVDSTRRRRELTEAEFDAYKQRAELAEESNAKALSDLRQTDNSVAGMEGILNSLLNEVKTEQGNTNTLNAKLRERRAEFGRLTEFALDIEVEMRSLQAKRKMLQEQLRAADKSARAAVAVNTEKTTKEFQARLRALELDLNLQRDLIPKLRAALEKLEKISDVGNVEISDVATPKMSITPQLNSSPKNMTPRNDFGMRDGGVAPRIDNDGDARLSQGFPAQQT
eukprot:GEMP01017036.1.p1 GENE.GEMP01017036.1~~GEMP01017036.1.p1  ORF type:complete len:744 (+),score=260.29 GEMP01017036.1:120-2351(+)